MDSTNAGYIRDIYRFRSLRLDDIITKGKDVSEDEFNEKFIEVFNKIKSYKPQYSVI
jgi:hypothetical protein